MNIKYKNLLSIAFSGLICLFLALPASAQHRGAGSGGGGSRPSSGGGGGGGFSRPSGGSVSRPSGGSFSRPSSGNSRPQATAVAPPRQNTDSRASRPAVSNSGQNRPNVSVQNRSSIGNSRVRGNVSAARPYVRGRVGNYGRYGYGYRGGNYGRYGYGNRGGYRYFNRGFYHNRGYYSSYYLPHIGFSIGFLPYGYYPFYYGNYQYYYSDGLYYQFNDNQYTVVEPPVGAQVNTLPSKAEAITINGEQYYEQNGVYYRPYTKDDGTVVYEVAGKDGQLDTGDGADAGYQAYQMGDILKQLPEDSRKITVNGEKLFVAPDGTYFQEQRDGDNNKVYKVVGLAADEPADEN